MGQTCIFRVDAAPFMGVGHLSRCLALAHALDAHGARVVFICRAMPGGAHGLVAQQGFELHMLPAPASSDDPVDTSQWLCCGQAQDAAETLSILRRESLQPDWLIVDHYGIDSFWETRLRTASKHIFVIDDLANRPHDCDLLLDQSLREDNPYINLVPRHCIALLGPRYAMLREEFANQRKVCVARAGNIRKVLVFFGGSDQAGDTLKAVHALISLDAHISAEIVIGALNVNREAIERLCLAHPHLEPVFQVSNMADRLSRADLAIGGGGTVSWERLALGTPALLVEQADNQAQNISQLIRNGVAVAIGKSQEITSDQITQALRALMAAPGRIREMSARAISMVDAQGTQRVVDALIRPQVEMRRAGPHDCDIVYNWRNSPQVRRFSRQTDEIELGQHRRWFRETLENPDRDLLIGIAGGEPIGVIRFDVSDVRAVISIYLTPNQLGRGWGAWLLQSAERWLEHERGMVDTLDAQVLDENATSKRMFESLGYRHVQGIFTKRLRYE